MLGFFLKDGWAGKNTVKVQPEGTLNVVTHPHPPAGETLIGKPFRQYFTDNGTSTGSNDMTVDGSSTSADFFVIASATEDVYVKSISVIIGDGGAPALNKYGALNALSNGTLWCASTQEDGLYELHDGIKTNLEFIRVGVDTAAIGDSTTAFLADVSGGGTEKSYIPTIDLAETFGLQYGIRLRAGTNDKLTFTIQDDLTGLTTHNAIGYGLRI